MVGERWSKIVVVTLALAFVLAVAPAALGASPPPPGGFRLPASHGYSLHARFFDGDPKGEADALLLFFERKDGGVIYAARKGVEVTDTSVSADLGDLGSIDMQFVATGQPRQETSVCGESFAVDSGFYEGRFDFEGEEGFTSVHVTRARGEISFLLNIFCADLHSEGSGGASPGAQLRVLRRSAQGRVELEAKANSPTRPAHFRAQIDERRGNLAILRGVEVEAGATAFEFDVPRQVARLRPPAPFQGTAVFRRPGNAPGHLSGRLTVDLPGHADVSLTGARGGLRSYVENPSHPFRASRGSTLSAWPSTKPSPFAFATPSPLALK